MGTEVKDETALLRLDGPEGGEGNRSPLRYTGLGNPMDRGAWQAAALGAARSGPRLRDSTTADYEEGRWRRRVGFGGGELELNSSGTFSLRRC